MTVVQFIGRLSILLVVACLGVPEACAQAPAAAVWQPYRLPPADGRGIADKPADHASSITQVEYTEPLPGEVFFPPPGSLETDVVGEMVVTPVGVPVMSNATNYYPVNQPWHFQVLPDGVIWSSYMAGVRESRTSGVVYGDATDRGILDVTLGGRMAIFRNGTTGPVAATGRPEGLEFQIEGAALPRLNLDENWDLESVDFRFGLPVIFARDQWQWKFSYYHLSAHLGDELIIRESASSRRINYSRDVLVAGFSYFTSPAWRWYAEAGWAFYTDGGAQPWEAQMGLDIAEPGPTGGIGTPFFAINGHLRDEVDFGGNVVVQAGWLWRGDTGRTVRTGLHYLNGKSSQYEFFDQFESQIGGGIWADY